MTAQLSLDHAHHLPYHPRDKPGWGSVAWRSDGSRGFHSDVMHSQSCLPLDLHEHSLRNTKLLFLSRQSREFYLCPSLGFEGKVPCLFYTISTSFPTALISPHLPFFSTLMWNPFMYVKLSNPQRSNLKTEDFLGQNWESFNNPISC